MTMWAEVGVRRLQAKEGPVRRSKQEQEQERGSGRTLLQGRQEEPSCRPLWDVGCSEPPGLRYFLPTAPGIECTDFTLPTHIWSQEAPTPRLPQ